MPPSSRLRMGEGARCSVLLLKLRPSSIVSAHFVNKQPRQRLGNLIAIQRESAIRRGKQFKHVFFSSTTLPGKTLQAATCFCVVRDQAQAIFWDSLPDAPPSAPPGDGMMLPVVLAVPALINPSVLNAGTAQKILPWFAIRVMKSTTTTILCQKIFLAQMQLHPV